MTRTVSTVRAAALARAAVTALAVWGASAAGACASLLPVSFKDIATESGSGVRPGQSFDYEAIEERYVSDVAWSQAPTYAETLAAYPLKARERGVGGHATLDCAFTKAGALTDCEVVAEDPGGYGFGQAALALSKRFVAPDALPDGAKLEGAGVQVEFAFAPEMLQTAEPVIGQPIWTALPTVEDFTAALPADASKAGVDAVVVLDCTVQAGGSLGGCKVTSEDPSGFALGQAALLLAPKFRVKVWSDDGMPLVGGALRAPIRVKLDTPGKP